MAAISASVSAVAYAIYALGRLCDYFKKPLVAVGMIAMEKIFLAFAYIVYACYLIYYYMNQGKCGSLRWIMGMVLLYMVTMLLTMGAIAKAREDRTSSSLPR